MDGINAPLGFLLTWGEPIGDIDVGYGPARALKPSQVRDVFDVLAEISPESFAERIDVATLEVEGVYRAESFSRENLVSIYTDMRTFVSKAAAAQRGLVVALV